MVQDRPVADSDGLAQGQPELERLTLMTLRRILEDRRDGRNHRYLHPRRGRILPVAGLHRQRVGRGGPVVQGSVHGHLSRVLVDGELAVLVARGDGVESLLSWVTESQKALRLAASAVSVASVNSEWRQEISGALQHGDAAFAMMNNNAELQVLAASAVAQLFKGEGAVADVAALGVMTGTFGDREPEVAPGLTQLARDYLESRALSVRVLVQVRQGEHFTAGRAGYLTRLSNEVSEALAEDKDRGSVSVETVEVLYKAVSKLKDYIAELANAEFDISNRVIESQAILSEGNDILWWLINGYSRELKKLRAEASTAELVLPTARELAGLISREVPPAASSEYLRHTLSSAMVDAPTHLTIMEAVAATAPEWRFLSTSAELPEGADRLFPIHAGLHIGCDAPDEADWNRALAERTGLTSDFAATPEEIGVQFLNELSLASRYTSTEPKEE